MNEQHSNATPFGPLPTWSDQLDPSVWTLADDPESEPDVAFGSKSPEGDSADGLTDHHALRLDDHFEWLSRRLPNLLGLAASADFDHGEIHRFESLPMANGDDPWGKIDSRLDTHEFDREVIAWLGELAGLPRGDQWGYVTSGGSEGNFRGLLLARQRFPESTVFYSDRTHRSVRHALECLRMQGLPIKSHADGRINLDHLYGTLGARSEYAPIIVANIGTTVHGAIDDLPGILRTLRELEVDQWYVHADAALAGMVLPMVDSPQPWNFEAGVDSLSIAVHKLIGTPQPCGVVLARRSGIEPGKGSTLLGSRSALAPLWIWRSMKALGREGFQRRIAKCFETADYAIDQLNELGLRAWRHRNSLTVVFDRPCDEIARRWHLPVDEKVAHLMAMPHVTRSQIDRLLQDLLMEG